MKTKPSNCVYKYSFTIHEYDTEYTNTTERNRERIKYNPPTHNIRQTKIGRNL